MLQNNNFRKLFCNHVGQNGSVIFSSHLLLRVEKCLQERKQHTYAENGYRSHIDNTDKCRWLQTLFRVPNFAVGLRWGKIEEDREKFVLWAVFEQWHWNLLGIFGRMACADGLRFGPGFAFSRKEPEGKTQRAKIAENLAEEKRSQGIFQEISEKIEDTTFTGF